MRILYLSQSYVPSRRASSVHVMRMCAALARSGHRVTLVTKRSRSRTEPEVADDFAFYGVEPGFRVLKLARPAIRGGGLVFAWLRDRCIRHSPAEALLYCRDLGAAKLGAAMGRTVVFEAHQPPVGRSATRLFRRIVRAGRLRRLVAISQALRAELDRLGLLPAGLEVVVAPDAADPHPERRQAAQAPAPPAGRGGLRIGYVGSFHPGKGAEHLLRLAARLPEHEFHLTGGDERDLAHLAGDSPPANLRLRGFAPPARVPEVLERCDLLLMPYGRTVLGAARRGDIGPWMSPLKMFEYMAAGKPIVSSDLPVLREVLEDGRNALLAPADDLAAWEAAIRRLAADPELARRLGRAARVDLLTHHTWDARAAAVLADLSDETG